MGSLAEYLKTEQEAVEMERQLYLSSLLIFTKFFLKYMDVTKAVHGEMIQVLESDATKKIIVEPRGIFKTSVAAISYPIYRLLKNPNLTILLDSELYTNSKNTLRAIKGHLESEEMTRVFGSQVGRKWDEGEITIADRTDHSIKEASITVGGIGTTKIGQHYKLIIGDDYCSPDNTDTPDKCQKVINHVRYNLSVLSPGGEYVWIGTRYAERDIVGFLLSDVLGQRHLAEGKMKLVTADESKETNDSFI